MFSGDARLKCLFVSAFCVLLIGVHVVNGGNCTNVAMEVIERAGVRYEIVGPQVRVYPVSNGVRAPNVYLGWDQQMLVERNRSYTYANGRPIVGGPRCMLPSCDLGGLCPNIPVDPLFPRTNTSACPGNVDNIPCGELLSYFRQEDFNCYITHHTEPFFGHNRESVNLTYSHPSAPDFRLVSMHYVLDADLDLYPIENNTDVVNRYRHVFSSVFTPTFTPRFRTHTAC